jgi:Undecaprenyl-phosphate glucose phosphotransferase
MLDDHPDRRQNADLFSLARFDLGVLFPPREILNAPGASRDTAAAADFLHDLTADVRRPPDAGARILNSQAYAPAALSIDAAVIVLMAVLTGFAYDVLALGRVASVLPYMRNGLLVSVLFFGIARLKAAQLPLGTSLAYERARVGLSSWAAAFVLFLFTVFVLKASSDLSRGATLLFFVCGGLSVALTRVNGPLLTAHILSRSALACRNIIVVGPLGDPTLVRLASTLRGTLVEPPYIVAFNDNCGLTAWPEELRRVVKRTLKIAHGAMPGEVLVVSGRLSRERLSTLLEGLSEVPRSICLVPDNFTASCLRQKIATIGRNVAIEVQRAPLDAGQRALKRSVDIAVSLFAILFMAPLLIGVAVAIKADSKGPVFFRQTRTGYRGRLFKIYKFRTMTVLEDGPVVSQARRNDNRCTKLGAFLRRSSIDELPQLYNVLLGDMSLVGPRPHAVAHDEMYEREIANYALRQHVLPGITGWAQVNGLRGGTSEIEDMQKRVEHDVWYVRHCSLLLDIQIMARTAFEIFHQRNAY